MWSRIITLSLMAVCFMPRAARAADTQETLKATVVDANAKKAEEAKKPAAAASADGAFVNTACTNGKNKRVVELTSTNATTKLPCEVHYKKATEQQGHDQVLWQAANDLKFCESKAQAFVDKLASWGWTCGKM